VRFDLTTLKLFVSVIEHGSITRAAESEHIVPSAASKRISDLEAQLGVELLVRRRAGVVPTPAGEALSRQAREVMKSLDRIPESLGVVAAAEQPEIRIGANQTAVVVMVADLEPFIERHPGVKIRLEEAKSPAIIDGVAQGNLDIGIIGHFHPADRLKVVPYRGIPLRLVVPLTHPLAERETVSFAEALEFDLITFTPGSAIRSWALEAAARVARAPKFTMQVTSYEAMRAMVHTGLGAAVIPEPNILPFEGALKVRAVPLSEDWALMRLNVVYAGNMPRVQAIDDLIAHLTSI
jgi:DNA-binding transcriptional LysR family regulator